MAQTQWIRDNAERRHQVQIHLGDIVQNAHAENSGRPPTPRTNC